MTSAQRLTLTPGTEPTVGEPAASGPLVPEVDVTTTPLIASLEGLTRPGGALDLGRAGLDS